MRTPLQDPSHDLHDDSASDEDWRLDPESLRARLDALEQARASAEAANAAKSRYLVTVGHEIRSPLNAIYGYAQLLSRGGKVSPTEAGEAIRRSAEHLMSLVEGMLEVSRIECGVVTVQSGMVRLPTLLDDIIQMFRMQAEARGLTLTLEVAGRLPPIVRTDEKRLRQILINLLSNAVKYTVRGEVTLRFSYRTQVAQIDVIDTGIGIAPDDLDRIFEPFERILPTDSTAQPGYGMGLAITRMLARIMGGEVSVDSTPGKGSRFRLRLFLPEPAEAPAALQEARRIIGYAGAPRTVLIVDDDEAQTAILAEVLRPLGFVVYTAAQGREAILLADRCAPELVLLDIQMPTMSGWEVAERLRMAHGRALRIIMVSGSVDQFRDPGTDGAAHDACFPKPVDQQALLDLIGQQLALRWVHADEQPPKDRSDALGKLPATAIPLLDQLRHLARIGDARALEAQLDALEAEQPDSTAAVAAMRAHLQGFDLVSFIKTLDHVRPD